MKHKLIFITLILLIFILPIFPSSQHRIVNQFELKNNFILKNCHSSTRTVSLLQKSVFWIQKQTINIPQHSSYNYYQWDIYYDCDKLDPQPNIATFNTIMDNYYAYDKDYVYSLNQLITWLNYPLSATLSKWSMIYLTKKEPKEIGYSVYIYNKKLEKTVNSKTFEFLPWGYSLDTVTNNVFLYDKIISGADSKSFVVVEPWIAYDKNHKYKLDKIVE